MVLKARLDPNTGFVDLVRDAGGNLETSPDGLEEAVLMSLFTNKRASEDDLPAGVSDRQGWWGDLYLDPAEASMGSLLWTLSQSRLTQETVEQARQYIHDSLRWMETDEVTEAVLVEVSRDGDRLLYSVDIPRSQDPASPWRRTWSLRLDAL